MSTAAGFGPSPLSFAEIDAWQRTTSIQLSSWEVLALRQISCTFVSVVTTATNPSMPPPWRGQDIEAKRETVVQAFKTLARSHQT